MSILRTRVTVKIPLSQSPAPDMSEKWEKTMHAVAGIMNQRREAKIASDGDFQTKLAHLAIPRWTPMLASGFVSQKEHTAQEILRKYSKNLRGAYEHWSGKLKLAFAEVDGIMAKRFKDQVTGSKKFWEEQVALKTLPVMGSRVYGEGPAPIVAAWLVGDKKASSLLRPGDSSIGEPFNITRTGMKAPFKAGLMGLLQRVATGIILADYNPADILAYNNTLNVYVQGFTDPALGLEPFTTGGTSHLDFLYEGTVLKIEAQVSQV